MSNVSSTLTSITSTLHQATRAQTRSSGLAQIQQVARQISTAASRTTRSRDQADPTSAADPAETTIDDYDINTSTIVRTAVVSGVIVLVLTILVLFFRVTSWIRYHQRLRRQAALHQVLRNEQRANAYEIAAWADEPGQAPTGLTRGDRRAAAGVGHAEKEKKKRVKKATKRGAANAYGISEWEGVAQ